MYNNTSTFKKSPVVKRRFDEELRKKFHPQLANDESSSLDENPATPKMMRKSKVKQIASMFKSKIKKVFHRNTKVETCTVVFNEFSSKTQPKVRNVDNNKRNVAASIKSQPKQSCKLDLNSTKNIPSKVANTKQHEIGDINLRYNISSRKKSKGVRYNMVGSPNYEIYVRERTEMKLRFYKLAHEINNYYLGKNP